MARFKTVYTGELHTHNIHIPSSSELETDAPIDNMGKGANFSPTDLCALSLTSCILTTMGIYAAGQGIDLHESNANTEKIMANDPRRIAEIKVELWLCTHGTANEHQKEMLKKIVSTCPVSRSLNSEIVQNVVVNWVN